MQARAEELIGHLYHLRWYLDEELIGPQSQRSPQHVAERKGKGKGLNNVCGNQNPAGVKTGEQIGRLPTDGTIIAGYAEELIAEGLIGHLYHLRWYLGKGANRSPVQQTGPSL